MRPSLGSSVRPSPQGATMSRPPLRPSAGPVRRGSGPRSLLAPRWSRLISHAVAAVIAGAVVVGGGGVALADPENPTDQQLDEARVAQQAAAAEVGRIAGLVAAAESQLQQVQDQAEAAGTAYLQAEEARQAADAAADQAAQDLQVATAAVAAAQERIADFSRDSYMNGSSMPGEMALLDADGPSELVRKAAMLDYVADHQIDVLGALEAARRRQADADAAARAARDE